MFPLDECSFLLSSYNVMTLPSSTGFPTVSITCPGHIPGVTATLYPLFPFTHLAYPHGLPSGNKSLFLVCTRLFLFCSFILLFHFVFYFTGKWSHSVSVSQSHLLPLAKCSPGPSPAEVDDFFPESLLESRGSPSAFPGGSSSFRWFLVIQIDGLETPEVRHPVSTSLLMFQQRGSDQRDSRWFLRQPGPSTQSCLVRTGHASSSTFAQQESLGKWPQNLSFNKFSRWFS